MTDHEAILFTQKKNFKDLIKLRLWDDKAKLIDYPVPSITTYRDLLMSKTKINNIIYKIDFINTKYTLDYITNNEPL